VPTAITCADHSEGHFQYCCSDGIRLA